ncbi:hypothetical protein FA95DRAFT_1193190 [Auriscalpium vulgare]|uniref:Uncharacterized protein n=1 Tax=Auriscalpium vulgare TaxID=40419 RepID=A0ACB8RW08_9AGAM|nr:hypothetical protein FA95DRAFT_1193190 [Auriscalpium vulgare]
MILRLRELEVRIKLMVESTPRSARAARRPPGLGTFRRIRRLDCTPMIGRPPAYYPALFLQMSASTSTITVTDTTAGEWKKKNSHGGRGYLGDSRAGAGLARLALNPASCTARHTAAKVLTRILKGSSLAVLPSTDTLCRLSGC